MNKLLTLFCVGGILLTGCSDNIPGRAMSSTVVANTVELQPQNLINGRIAAIRTNLFPADGPDHADFVLKCHVTIDLQSNELDGVAEGDELGITMSNDRGSSLDEFVTGVFCQMREIEVSGQRRIRIVVRLNRNATSLQFSSGDKVCCQFVREL